jgi:hypothetical protein
MPETLACEGNVRRLVFNRNLGQLREIGQHQIENIRKMKVQIDWPLCDTFVRPRKGNSFCTNFISDFVKMIQLVSRIAQEFGSLLRLPVIFNVNQLQGKKTVSEIPAPREK